MYFYVILIKCKISTNKNDTTQGQTLNIFFSCLLFAYFSGFYMNSKSTDQ